LSEAKRSKEIEILARLARFCKSCLSGLSSNHYFPTPLSESEEETNEKNATDRNGSSHNNNNGRSNALFEADLRCQEKQIFFPKMVVQ
jgi:hypothetical protein